MSQRAGDATASAVTPVILTRALEKVYAAGSEAEVVALKGVDVRILPGEFVAIMGPSGSGKSTLMNLIGCLDTPTAGSYACDGVDVSTLDAEELAVLRRDKIGFVFQGFNLLPRMSALENVAMPMGYSNVPRIERLQRASLGSAYLCDAFYRVAQMVDGPESLFKPGVLWRVIFGGSRRIVASEPPMQLEEFKAAS